MSTLAARLPDDAGFAIMYGLLAVVVLAAGIFIGVEQKTRYVTRTVKVEKSWGRPDQVLPAAQMVQGASANGVTVCDWFADRKTLVCHP